MHCIFMFSMYLVFCVFYYASLINVIKQFLCYFSCTYNQRAIPCHLYQGHACEDQKISLSYFENFIKNKCSYLFFSYFFDKFSLSGMSVHLCSLLFLHYPVSLLSTPNITNHLENYDHVVNVNLNKLWFFTSPFFLFRIINRNNAHNCGYVVGIDNFL